ncbi:MAG: DNA translocase FtsK 4TM domain-containing protein [Bacteroidota bacterium]
MGILLMVTALLILLALISYNAADEAVAGAGAGDLVGVLIDDADARAMADRAGNWLGLAGAVISSFLIKSTLGYSILCLPFLLGAVAWTILRGGEIRRLRAIVNYTLVTAILISSLMGMARLILGPETLLMEWSGAMGDFLAAVLSGLLGKAGGSLVLLTGLVIVIVLVTDVDLRKAAGLARDAAAALPSRLVEWKNRLYGPRREGVGAGPEPETRPGGRVRIRKPPLEEPPGGLPEGPGEEAGEPPREASILEAGRGAEEPAGVPLHPVPGESAPGRGALSGEAEQDAPHESPGGPPPGEEEPEYVFPGVDLLNPPRPQREEVAEEELRAHAALLRETLAQFDVELENISVTPGPVVTLYELVPASGVKIARIVSLENDIALKLAAKGIRIMAPIPGKSAVGVEIPNSHPAVVTIRSVLNSARFRETDARLPLALGKTISGEVFTDDLSRMPHLLIAGSTGSGKSVGINTMLASLLFRLHPSDLKLVLIDPKKIELTQYGRLAGHFLAVSPDVDEQIITAPRNAVLALKGVEFEMERRYDRLAAAGVRSITDYNERVRGRRLRNTDTIVHAKMPYIVVVIDELADLMMTAAREVEEPIARLAQLARAVGIHLVLATQRPSVDVITGVIKANFPARIAYQVATKIDSRTILDANGAEQLLGNGDMLYLASGSPKPVRLQNAYIAPEEVDALTEHIGRQKGYAQPFLLPSILERKKGGEGAGPDGRDDLFSEAARLIVRHQQGSVSLLQRRLKVGYSRAARLVDELESAGIVGPYDGSKAREVLIGSESELDAFLRR